MSIQELLKTAPPKDVTRLILLRHGEAEAGPGVIVGNAEVPLSARGREQMERAKRLLTGVALHSVYTSDMKRATESCRILLEGRSTGLPTQIRALQEQNFGSWQGRTLEQLRSSEPNANYFADPVEGKPPGGESLSEVKKRIVTWWRQESPKHKGSTLLVVTSLAPIRSFLCEALDLPLARAQRLSPDYGTLTILDDRPSFWLAHIVGA